MNSEERNATKGKVAIFIKKFIGSKYHLYISDKNSVKLTSGMISIVMDDVYNTKSLTKTSLFELATKWFRTSNIKGTLETHSVGGFIKFIDKNYNIYFFPKRGLRSIILKIVLFLLRIG